MNTRERTLAILLIGMIVLIAGGVVGYMAVWSPLQQANQQLAKTADEIKELEANKTNLLIQQYEYENKTRQKSLPADRNVSQPQYGNLIDHMLRQAKFTAPVITSRGFNDKSNVPMLAGKKPAYAMLDFDVQVKGDLLHLVDFLYNFYRQPLLHQIKNVIILKPSSSGGSAAAGSRDLTITLSIQALVLDRAEDRRTLLAAVPSMVALGGGAVAIGINIRSVDSGQGSPFTAPGVLARGEDGGRYTKTSAQAEYQKIAGKNIFFDPIKPSQEKPPSVAADPSPYLELVEVSHSNGMSKAMICDRLNKQDYEIQIDSKGSVIVTHYWYDYQRNAEGLAVEEFRKYYPRTKTLNIGDERTGNVHKFLVRRILENELVLEAYDPTRDKVEKEIKAADAFVLGAAASTLTKIMPAKVKVWRVGHFLASVDPKRGAAEGGNLDAKRASVEVTSAKSVREIMTRPLEFANEGNGLISFASDEGQFPTDEQATGGKKMKVDGAAGVAGAADPGAAVAPGRPQGKNKTGKKGKGKGN